MFGRRQASANSSTRSGVIRIQSRHAVSDNRQVEQDALALNDPFTRSAVECLLVQNLARAAAAQTEANRLANLLATNRGISTQEYMDRIGTSGQFLEINEDLPPAYEDCVTAVPVEDSPILQK